MSDSNWIKLNRGIWDNFIWDFEKPKYALAWIDMLLMANYKDKKILFDGKVEVVKRGSFITSMVKLAERWNMDRATVKRFLDVLQNDGMITYSCNNRRTLINIVNYSTFQSFGVEDTTTESTTDSATHTTAESTAESTTHSTQHKKVKKIKESKESKKSYSDVPELNVALISFTEYRKGIKKPMSDHAVALMVNKLNKMTSNVQEQIEILNQSIVNGWQGIFPLNGKEQRPSRPKNGFTAFSQREYSPSEMDEIERMIQQSQMATYVDDDPELKAEAEALKKELQEKY